MESFPGIGKGSGFLSRSFVKDVVLDRLNVVQFRSSHQERGNSIRTQNHGDRRSQFEQVTREFNVMQGMGTRILGKTVSISIVQED
jgi:hypothetical protein